MGPSPLSVLAVSAVLNSVEFDVTYIPETSENIKMVVVVKDESGAVIGASYQTLEKVKGAYPELPVLMLSAMADEKIVKKTLELGASGFVAKPFKPEDLLEHLKWV